MGGISAREFNKFRVDVSQIAGDITKQTPTKANTELKKLLKKF